MEATIRSFGFRLAIKESPLGHFRSMLSVGSGL